MPLVYLATTLSPEFENAIRSEYQRQQPPPRRWSFARVTCTFFGGVLLFLIARPISQYLQNSYRNHPANLELSDCVKWLVDSPSRHSHLETATVTFELDVPTERLFIMSVTHREAGGAYRGSIRFVPSSEDSDTVKVELVAKYAPSLGLGDFLNNVWACRARRKQGEEGLLLSSPHLRNDDPRHARIHYESTVYLPSGKANDHNQTSTYFIPGLETRLPLFAHVIENLSSITFGSVSLGTSNMPVSAKFLRAKHTVIWTSNAPIEGAFNSTSDIELHTSNAQIKALVGLENDSSRRASRLNAATSDAPLDIAVHLTASQRPLVPYKSAHVPFSISTKTCNGRLNLSVASSLAKTILRVDSRTSNAPIVVSLSDHPFYQGTFSLTSSLWEPSRVQYDQDIEGSGWRGRRRVVGFRSGQLQRRLGVVEGMVEWVGRDVRDGLDDTSEAGFVRVSTSNSQAVLEL